jgi:hypothetical protein
MTIYTEDRDTSELLLEARHRSFSRFWKRGEKGGQALESADTPIRFLNFAEQTVQEQYATPTYSSSFTTPTQKGRNRIAAVIPQLEGANLHHPVLTSKVRHLIRNFWAIVVSKALQASFPIGKTSIAVFNDPAEDRQQVVLQVLTEANASQAMAFWESLENDIHEWVSQLDDRNRLIFVRDISLRIHWQ